jgi:hypothetical protein
MKKVISDFRKQISPSFVPATVGGKGGGEEG